MAPQERDRSPMLSVMQHRCTGMMNTLQNGTGHCTNALLCTANERGRGGICVQDCPTRRGFAGPTAIQRVPQTGIEPACRRQSPRSSPRGASHSPPWTCRGRGVRGSPPHPNRGCYQTWRCCRTVPRGILILQDAHVGAIRPCRCPRIPGAPVALPRACGLSYGEAGRGFPAPGELLTDRFDQLRPLLLLRSRLCCLQAVAPSAPARR